METPPDGVLHRAEGGAVVNRLGIIVLDLDLHVKHVGARWGRASPRALAAPAGSRVGRAQQPTRKRTRRTRLPN